MGDVPDQTECPWRGLEVLSQCSLGRGQPGLTHEDRDRSWKRSTMSLHLKLGQDDGALASTVEKLIDKLARASYRVDQSRKVKALVPPVFNVDLEYGEAISAAGKRDPALPSAGVGRTRYWRACHGYTRSRSWPGCYLPASSRPESSLENRAGVSASPRHCLVRDSRRGASGEVAVHLRPDHDALRDPEPPLPAA